MSLALAAMLFAVSMTFIDQTIVSIAAPSIVDELSLSSSGMQWVVNAYLLSLAVVIAVFPVDRRGRALALLFGLSGALTAVGPPAWG
ncbi:hypothetical protein GCM10010346_18710 [Streptomyces chryseus]|uniref:MFS transporter n=1 Tax=Streptomyces chryseus TaxID=68186 RepID=A0ABQ3DJ93_9ACTN|nr:hypothetical protein GCM10010346_18710 [Streptomyces chryseus]